MLNQRFTGRRESIRWVDHDYTLQAGYLITICTHQGRSTLCCIDANGVHLTALGELVVREWRRTGEIRPEVELDEFVVMPNHVLC